jgi:hypothetical protein
MTKYKCGHETKIIILDDNPVCLSAYLIWKDSTGYNGNKTLCWSCWCKDKKEKETKEPDSKV